MKTRIVLVMLMLLSFIAAFSQQWDVVLKPYEIYETRSLEAAQVRDWGHAYLQASEFGKTQGAGAYIFILDTGIETNHPDLVNNLELKYAKDFTNSTSGFEDKNGHGTHCAGIAAAINNSFGVIGIAPNAKLVPIKVLNDQGQGAYSWITSGIKYVADLQIKEKKIISMSLGGSQGNTDLHNAIKYAISKGVFIVVAAGNSGCNTPETIGFPGNYPEVITVGSLDRNEQPSVFSSCGKNMDISAPGSGIYSTHLNGSYAYLSGTSMATPQVAGIAALLVAYYDIKTQVQLEAYLAKYAKPLFSGGWNTRTGAGAPIATRYTVAPDQPDNPEPPVDTIPTPPTPPDRVYSRRVVSIPIRASFEDVMFKGGSDASFRFIGMGGLIVEYRTTEPAHVAYEKINRLTENYFRNRGYILPDSQADMDFCAGWVAYFYRLILRQESGLDVTISEAWVSEGKSDNRTLVKYTKSFPVGSRTIGERAFRRQARRGNAKSLTW